MLHSLLLKLNWLAYCIDKTQTQKPTCVPTCAVRETASLGIMGAPQVPPLNPSESILSRFARQFRTIAQLARNVYARSFLGVDFQFDALFIFLLLNMFLIRYIPVSLTNDSDVIFNAFLRPTVTLRGFFFISFILILLFFVRNIFIFCKKSIFFLRKKIKATINRLETLINQLYIFDGNISEIVTLR